MTRSKWVGCCAVLAVGLLAVGCRGATEVGSPPGARERGPDEGRAAKAGGVGRATPAPGVEGSSSDWRPVVLTTWIKPDPPTGSEPIKATVRVWDKEGDRLTYEFKWIVNGTAVEGVEGDTLPAGRIKRGDTVRVVVRASDGKEWGDPRESDAWKVVNGPPVITSTPPDRASLKEAIYVYAVSARDPDGDDVTYILKQGPSGMTLDPKTGRLAWPLDRGVQGVGQRIVVAARDQEGAETTQAFTVTFSVSEKQP